MKRVSWKRRCEWAEQRAAQAEFAARLNGETVAAQAKVIAELEALLAREKNSCIAISARYNRPALAESS